MVTDWLIFLFFLFFFFFFLGFSPWKLRKLVKLIKFEISNIRNQRHKVNNWNSASFQSFNPLIFFFFKIETSKAKEKEMISCYRFIDWFIFMFFFSFTINQVYLELSTSNMYEVVLKCLLLLLEFLGRF